MNRFHSSMSWNAASSTGSTDPGSVTDESARGNFRLEDVSWSSLPANRTFFVPLHYTASYQYPLLIWFHSNGYNETQIDQVMPHISVRNHIGVGIRGTFATDSAGHRFQWRESPASVAAAHDSVVASIDECSERFNIHPQRIVLAGYGTGGTMAMRIAMREPERFAGVISMGGRFPQGSIRNVSQLRERRIPMLWQWGRMNPEFPRDGFKADFLSLMSIGGQVEVRQYPGDDEMDSVVLSDLNDWIMRRIVADSTVSDSDQWSTSPTAYSSN